MKTYLAAATRLFLSLGSKIFINDRGLGKANLKGGYIGSLFKNISWEYKKIIYRKESILFNRKIGIFFRKFQTLVYNVFLTSSSFNYIPFRKKTFTVAFLPGQEVIIY